MEMKLTKCRENRDCIITSITGNHRFLDRVSAMGITPNTKIQIIQNRKRQPVLLYTRDTLIALNRDESMGIYVKEVE